jgi:DNA-binding ferritin-like protein
MSAYPLSVHILRRPELEPNHRPPKLEEPSHIPAERSAVDPSATQFPKSYETGPPEELIAKLYGCSGSMDTTCYQEATKFRALGEMDWTEARLALNRLINSGQERRYPGWEPSLTRAEYIAVAEFALTASNFNFAGKKGEAAPKFRNEVSAAIKYLAGHLSRRLSASAKSDEITAAPVTDLMSTHEKNDALRAMVPLPDGVFVMVRQATPEQALASLEYMRRRLADQAGQRAFAEQIAERLRQQEEVTAQQYANALSTASVLEFVSAKLAMLYSGIAHSIPLYRLYPATPEREAIELWWPWGRAMPLVDGGPAKAPTPRKKVLDPSIITAKRPQDVVREVIERTGHNRTTAQRLTADMRAEMRREREAQALAMLRNGKTKAEVARTFGLSPSRVSAMFKGMTFPKKAKPIDLDADDDDAVNNDQFWCRNHR